MSGGYKFNPFTGTLDRVGSDSGSNNDDIAEKLELTKIAAENISALNVVRLNTDTTVSLAVNDTFTNAQAIGIALNAGNVGQSVTIHLFGVLSDPFFNFVANEPIYLDSVSGNITAVPPTSGFVSVLGHGLGPGGIWVQIEEPIAI